MNPFSLEITLPAGPTLVEASAGTGKTWSIARLVARMLVEPGPGGTAPPTIGQILVVTFTEAATAELRDRLRALLVEAGAEVERVHRAVATGTTTIPAPSAQSGLAVLAGQQQGNTWQPLPADELAERMVRLRQAVFDFDTAPVRTIHGFCQHIVQQLSFESDAPFGGQLLTNTDDLLKEIVDDWMAKVLVQAKPAEYAWLTHKDGAGLKRDRLLSIAKARVANRDAAFQPTGGDLHITTDAHLQAAKALHDRFMGPEGQALLQTIRGWTAAKLLKNNIYRLDTLDMWYRDVGRWLSDGALGPLPSDLFTQSKLIGALSNEGKKLPEASFAAPLLQDLQGAADEPDPSAHIAAFAHWCASEFAKRLADRGALTFDDMLHRVRDGLANPAFCEAMRDLYAVALIDEFQDTDAVQWDIFRTVFLDSPRHRLVLIGDPKQAIYAFRGADIAVYQQARHTIAQRWPDRLFGMDANFRSDQALIDAFNAMMLPGPTLFEADIHYAEVQARQPNRLHTATGEPVPPVSLQWFDARALGGSADQGAAMEAAFEFALQAAAADIADVLTRGWQRTLSPTRKRAVEARDLAVLVSTNRRAKAMQQALLRRGVPATLSQSGSVFDSEEANWLQAWLDMLAAERDAGAARACAATPLGGLDGTELVAVRMGTDANAQAKWLAFLAAAARQRRACEAQGISVAFTAMMNEPGPGGMASAVARIAQLQSGERALTNLRHLAELLSEAELAEHHNLAGLARWLDDKRSDAAQAEDAAELRLESDADTVTIMTLHKSKGLQFPIVYLVDLADARAFRGRYFQSQPLRFHPAESTQLTVHLTGISRAQPDEVRQAWREIIEERQRLLYVGLTRAEHRLVIYAAPTTVAKAQTALVPTALFETSPLGLLTLGAGPASSRIANALSAVPQKSPLRPAEIRRKLAEFAAGLQRDQPHPLCIVEDVPAIPNATVRYQGPQPQDLVAAEVFPHDFAVDEDWRRESYSGLVGSRKISAVGDGTAQGRMTADPLPFQVDDRPGDDEREADEDEEHLADAGGLSDAGTAVAAEDEALSVRKLVIPYPPDVPTGDARDDAPVPLGPLPGGVEAGLWVHEVLEHLSFLAVPPVPKDRRLDLPQLIRRHGLRNGFETDRHDALLTTHLPAVLTTPLGPLTGQAQLCQLSDAVRLDEVKFDLPIGQIGAQRVDVEVQGARLAQVLGTPRPDLALPADYLDFVRSMKFRSLRGYLTGTIDLVFQHEVDGQMRWFVVDYKTNTLGPRVHGRVETSRARHYTLPWMAGEIARKHYYIQYLLYMTALHRYLRQRIRNYRYADHMGGALYLFVRGMTGPDTPMDGQHVRGVFHDRPDERLIENLSRVLAGEEMLP